MPTEAQMSFVCFSGVVVFLLFKKIIDFRNGGEMERDGEREGNIDLFHLFVHSLVDSYMCPDQGLNPQPWHTYQDDAPAN